MPLIVVCGKPASGKSTVTERICKFIGIRKPQQQIEIISDNQDALFNQLIYNDSHKEREHRGMLKSEVQRLLSKDCLIICDSLNYIKGFRYELFCVAKLVKTTYCVVHCDATDDICQRLNLRKDESERYEADIITELIMRFEEPNATNRWDSPLFTVKVGINDEADQIGRSKSEQSICLHGFSEGELPLENMYSWLFKGKNLCANESTQTAPLMAADFLHILDRITQEVVNSIIQQQRTALLGDTFTLPNCTLENDKLLFTRRRTLAELSRLRRQFINYVKMHPIEDKLKITSLFVNYLNANP